MVFDQNTSSLYAWQGGCSFTGLSMVTDRDSEPYGTAIFTDGITTMNMVKSLAGEIGWGDSRFDSWLVCSSGGEYQLRYWDSMSLLGIDPFRCAKVGLFAVNL